MKITAIYDNGGKTLDRYTVVTDEAARNGYGHDEFEMLGLNEGGNGFSQWSTGQAGRHLGKRVQFEELSEATQRHIAERVLA